MTAHDAPPAGQAAIDRFLAFHTELVAAKRRAASAATPPSGNDKDTPPDSGADVSSATMDIFMRLRVAICPSGTPPPRQNGVPDIGYVMAAVADEAMLHQVNWPGRHRWMRTLLEPSLYGSRIAGEKIFELGQAIADGRLAGRPDLAAAILLALTLDFRGRWRGIDDHGVIDALRQRLYETIYGHPIPKALHWPSDLPALPQEDRPSGLLLRLPRLAPWLVASAAVMAITLLLSDWVWRDATNDVLTSARQILSQTGGSGQAP